LICSQTEYQKAREELDDLTRWLARIESEDATVRKGLTTASIRRMICRVQGELAEYETMSVSAPPGSEKQAAPDDTGA
jgi:hypothetical protein